MSSDKKYPSLDLTYEFINPTQEWMLRRISAVDQRIHGLLTQSAIALVGIPAIVSAIEDGKIPWFLWGGIAGAIALVAFACIVIFGLYSARIGRLITIDPGKLILEDEGLDPPSYAGLEPTEFKKQLVQIASDNMHANNDLLDRKSWIADVMSLLFVVELVAGAAWGGVSLALSG